MHELLRDSVCAGNWTPFIGSGFSKQANAKLFPSWGQLLTLMIRRFPDLDPKRAEDAKEQIRSGQHPIAAETIRRGVKPDDWNRFLQKQFNDVRVRPSLAHQLLARLRPFVILTTNYDKLLEKACAQEDHECSALSWNDTPQMYDRLRERLPTIFKIHGTIDRPQHLILTQEEYAQQQKNEAYIDLLNAIFITSTVVFVGFSFDDPELTDHLKRLRLQFSVAGNPHFALVPDKKIMRARAAEVRETYGIVFQYYYEANNHAGLLSYLENFYTLCARH